MSEYKLIKKDTLTELGNITREYTGENKLYALDEMHEKLRPYSVQIIEGNIGTSIVLPDGITQIGDGVFSECDGLESISFPDSLVSIGNSAFENCGNLMLEALPRNITSIGAYAFEDCSNLTLTSLPDGLSSIEEAAFLGCSNIKLTSLPSNITSIKESAFQLCDGLVSIVLPENLLTIDDFAFFMCRNLESVTFKSTPTYISSSFPAFSGCDNLTTINVPWSEGEVEGAPWGATNATINYNCK